jgi:hypothetical protein
MKSARLHARYNFTLPNYFKNCFVTKAVNVQVCPTGFFCTPSAKFNCPPGSYCPQGTHNQFLCPNGTYGASEGLQNITQCTPCTGGYYCATAGLSSPTGLCDKGYFCGGSSTVATPFGEGSIGGYAITYNGETCVHADNYTVNDICPPGHQLFMCISRLYYKLWLSNAVLSRYIMYFDSLFLRIK